MSKNIIFFIIDSVFSKHLDDTPYRHTPMPFLKKLSQECIVCKQMYSQAPFTEGALLPILSGRDLLDRGAYIQKFKYRTTVLEEFQKNNYHTFINHYYPSVFPNYSFPGVDSCYYSSGFNFLEVWSYRLKYYSKMFLEDQLSNAEIQMLLDILDDNFKAWIKYFSLLIEDSPLVEIISPNICLNGIEDELNTLTTQYNQFNASPKAYLQKLFEKDTDHILFKIKTYQCDDRVSLKDKKIIQKRYHKIFDLIYQTNRNKNLKNLPFPLLRMCKSVLAGEFRKAYQYAAMYKNAVFDSDLYDRIGDNYPNFKAALSAHSLLEHAVKWIDSYTHQQEKPFFMYLHVDDAHSPESFFSTNSTDLQLLDSEFSNIKHYIEELPSSFHGSLTSDLSLLYIDGCLEYLFNELNARHLLDNTSIVITADHGFSYSYDPIRDTYVNNLHEENYHPPFIIYDRSLTPSIKTKYYQSKDIAPTLLDLAGLSIPDYMSGQSILGFDGRNFAEIEYMGAGCPDMIRRPLIMGVRTDLYAVFVSGMIQSSFADLELLEVYDLQKDKKEFHNIAKEIDRQYIRTELRLLENRFNEVQRDFFEYPNAFNSKS